MGTHRIRLDDDDIELIVSSLRARRAQSGAVRRHFIDRLVERLTDMNPGNPQWRFTEESQRKEPASAKALG